MSRAAKGMLLAVLRDHEPGPLAFKGISFEQSPQPNYVILMQF